MAHHWSEGVSTLRFTAREFQQELVEEALKHNLLTCPPSSAAFFVSLKVIQELAYQIRRPKKKRTFVLVPLHKIKFVAFELSRLTDLQVFCLTHIQEFSKSTTALSDYEVFVCTPETLEQFFEKKIITLNNINLIVIDQCHTIIEDVNLQKIMTRYMAFNVDLSLFAMTPRILAFTYPLFNTNEEKGSMKQTPIVHSAVNEYEKNTYLDRTTIFDTQSATDRTEPLQLECLKQFTDMCSKNEDDSFTEMNSFKYWHNPHDDICLEIEASPMTSECNNLQSKNEISDITENSSVSQYEILEYQLDKLEKILNCKTDMASDIVGLKRITGKPKEVILECETIAEEEKCENRKRLERFMKHTIAAAFSFLNDHRYDPTEIYGGLLYDEELKAIPNPCTEPKEMLELFLNIFEQLGPYAADKAAFAFLTKIEKMKIKIPYERHFLLLCLVSSIFIQIRAAAELIFQNYENEKDRITAFSTSKFFKLLDVLKLFKPTEMGQKSNDSSPKRNHTYKSQRSPQINNKNKTKLVEVDRKDISNVNSNNSKSNILNNRCEGENKSLHSNCEPGKTDLKGDSEEVLIVECEISNTKGKINSNSDNVNCSKSMISLDNIDNHSNICNTLKNCEKNERFNQSLVEINECNFKELETKIQNHCTKILNNDPVNETSKDSKDIGNKELKKMEALRTKVDVNKTDSKEICSVISIESSNNACEDRNTDNVDNVDGFKNQVNDIAMKKNETNIRGKGKGRGGKSYNYQHRQNNNDPDALCGLVFVEEPLLAKILSSLINEYCRNDEDLKFICAQYTVEKTVDPVSDAKEAETEHKLQEEVLKRFRIHECNLLVGTSFLEEGMDLPKCNLVVRWTPPNGYRSHARCRARARAPRSLYVLLALPPLEPLIVSLAHFAYIEKMLIRKCGWHEPPASEEIDAIRFSPLVEAYRPSEAAVNLSTAVTLLNRYCAKLPSDTFTRLVPLWTIESIVYKEHTLYVCTIRLPINCPFKHHIVGHPMPTKVLARRIAALQACKTLHKKGELDDNLMPIGKEGFRAMESDWLSLPPPSDLPKCMQSKQLTAKDIMQIEQNDMLQMMDVSMHSEPRPGTTKRKQYYYKKVAQAFTNCRPIIGKPCLAYQINSWLACPLPEKHNTRGRKLHPPEAYAEGFAILTSKPIQQIPVFPIFTRSGEVRVALCQLPGTVIISPSRQKLIHHFMKYTFAEVLRVHNHLMIFDQDGRQSRNSYYIVPTSKVTSHNQTLVGIDWNFLQLIYDHTNSVNQIKISNKPLLNIPNELNNKDKLCAVSEEKQNHNESPVCEIVNNLEINHVDEAPQEGECKEHKDEIVKDNNDDHIIKVEKNKKELSDKTDEIILINGASEEIITEKGGNINSKDKEKTKTVSSDLERSYEETLPNPYLASGETFAFDSEKFRDAVVMPWYRNQDQPQYFYVAEICWHLSPRSTFPSTQHATFEEYYKHKYGVKITQSSQPLLDVDHTSARLNLLTPRFVNRKGVALPTSSERTKRAKRESLEQKQILVPELCCAHPFRGALWRAAVALPCILYRLNSLLLADEIRRSVALRVALGNPKPQMNFMWPALDFGWSLAEILACDSKESKTDCTSNKTRLPSNNDIPENVEKNDIPQTVEVKEGPKTVNDILKEKEDADTEASDDTFEVGTWSNDMANNVNNVPEMQDYDDDDIMVSAAKLPGNVTICTSTSGGVDWNLCSDPLIQPSCQRNQPRPPQQRKYSVADSNMSYGSSDYDLSDDGMNSSDTDSDGMDFTNDGEDTLSTKDGIRIEYKSGNEAEAIEITTVQNTENAQIKDTVDVELEKEAEEKSVNLFKQFFYNKNADDIELKEHVEKFKLMISENENRLIKNGIVIKSDESLDHLKLSVDALNASEFPTKNKNSSQKIESIIKSHKSETGENNNTQPKILEKESEVETYIDDNTLNNFPEACEKALSRNELLHLYKEMLPHKEIDIGPLNIKEFLETGCITLDDLEKSKRQILKKFKSSMTDEEWSKYNFFSMKNPDDEDIEPTPHTFAENNQDNIPQNSSKDSQFKFSFDHQPDLCNHPGPSPSLILQALTMSNANDGINLERLETIGDSFLKYAITTYLYCTYQNIHEGKLSHLRSKQVSNLNLYRLGRRKSLGSRMVAYKFEPHDNWLPPCHRVPPHLERALIDTHIPSTLWNIADIPPLTDLSKEEVEKLVNEKVAQYHIIPKQLNKLVENHEISLNDNKNFIKKTNGNMELNDPKDGEFVELETGTCFVPYNLITQHSIPDKSVADCVEALIGAYLIECGPRGALLFMAWLGIRVLPKKEVILRHDHPFVKIMEEAKISSSKSDPKDSMNILNSIVIDGPVDDDSEICDTTEENKSVVVDVEQDPYDNQDDDSDFDEDDSWNWKDRVPGSLKPKKNDKGQWIQVIYGELEPPPSPLLRYVPDPEGELMQMLSGYENLEQTLNYRFRDRCYLLQAMTHASYSPNRLTDCYQRLEFLGDAVLDYLITRQLYEDPRRHSPGALTDLRSALVNNTIFASLAVRHGMHKYFRHLSPGLNEVLARFVKIQEENGHSISEDHYLIQEDECEQAEDVEVPKALGDLFESIAGAIFLDSGMSLDAVWNVYHALMQREIEAFSEIVPKSPVRELLEMEPETAKFGKPEKLADGRRVRVTVEVLGIGVFKGIGRNYRIAKCTAAKCALKRIASSSTRRHKNK